MLKSVSFPQLPFTHIAVTSPEGKSICSQPSVSILSLRSITDLVLSGLLVCLLGYIVFQSLLATVCLKPFMDGSCSATMSISHLVSLPLLIRSCWHSRDLLILCCQILRLVFLSLPVSGLIFILL